MSQNPKSQGTVLITGAAKRIGKAIALHLAGRGYNIVLHYCRSKDEARAASKEIAALGVSCDIFACDLADVKKTGKLIGQVTAKFPDLNVLVNNASVFEPSLIKETDIDTLHRHVTVNFDAPFILTRDFAKHCSNGHIINILDTHVAQGTTQHAAYLLSKKALHALTQVSAAELAPGIKVNAVAPGLIMPPEDQGEEYLDRLAKDIPMQCKGDAGQVAATVEYLLTSKYVTGETIFVDGGEHLI